MFQNFMNPSGVGQQFPNGNGFVNPYLERWNAMQPQQAANAPRYEITRVNGKNGADAFQMPPNSAILLLDETQPIVWLKQTDGAGYPTCTPYTIAPYQAQPEPDYNTLSDRISRLEALIDGKPDVTNAEPAKRGKRSGGADASANE